MKTLLKQLIQIDKITHNLSNYVILFTFAILTKYWIGCYGRYYIVFKL